MRRANSLRIPAKHEGQPDEEIEITLGVDVKTELLDKTEVSEILDESVVEFNEMLDELGDNELVEELDAVEEAEILEASELKLTESFDIVEDATVLLAELVEVARALDEVMATIDTAEVIGTLEF